MRTTGLALMIALLATTGCTTAYTFPTVGKQLAPDAAFSDIAVSIDGSLTAEQLATFRHLRGHELLRDAIHTELEGRGRIDSEAPYRLEIRVVGLRLKGWSDTLFGFDAGSSDDFLTIDVIVLENDERALQTGATVSSNRGAFHLDESTERLQQLSRSVAAVLTTQL